MQTVIGRALAAMLVLSFVHQTPAPDEAASLFARVVARAANDARAPFATYTVVVTMTHGGRQTVASWPTTEDITHGVVLASAFSDEERADPTTPHGFNIVARRRMPIAAVRTVVPDLDATTRWVNGPPVSSEKSDDVVGPVALAVDQNFGVTPPRAYRVADDQRTIADASDELTVIGRTGTVLPRYRVELLDVADGVAHLGLTPLRDPYRNRLRELWVDEGTSDVQRAVVAGIGDRPPFDRARWQVTFERREGATYVADVSSVEPLKMGRDALQIDIAFRNLALLAQSPIKMTFGIESPVRYLRDP